MCRCERVGVTKLVGDLECWRQTFDRLSDTLEDIDAGVSQSETNLSDVSQSTTVTTTQRLHRLHVSLACLFDSVNLSIVGQLHILISQLISASSCVFFMSMLLNLCICQI